jgi:hypothetical protein
VLRATPRSAASERDDGNRDPGARRPVRTAFRSASTRLARNPGPAKLRCRSEPKTADAEVAHESVMQTDHTPMPLHG